MNESKTESLKTHCPDRGEVWKLMYLTEDEEPERSVFNDHTGAEIKGESDLGSPPVLNGHRRKTSRTP